MKKNIIFLVALLLSSAAYSQVGINNETPKATLDVAAKTPSTTAEGIIAPRLSGDDIKAKDGQYLADQKGAIVYATSAVGTPSVKTANITTEGYYYFDGAVWVKFNSGTGASTPEPWQIQGTTNPATTNTQNIYQAGNVSIGSQTPIAPFTSNSVTITPKLSVTGNVATTGSYYTTTGKYADYVFEDYFDGASKIDETYKFRSLEETAAYIKANKHLPGVTSIKDILKTENGYTVNLSELSIQQLEKIEELYLHTIEQQEEISKQKTEINDLKSRMEKLEQLLVKENNNK
ncbi:hypothetical protein [Chryseobacterium sp. G0201]|uniref:hypothetical protein n=1 Tax=Chryseobacterium sp. G0201 TaxID=2487065 RepID=UPI000F502D35|nr:hypothetical protein [Chryseobacterium sp. G0201]AZA54015.1 hypothetical protein EG348_13905 [Chryseobacterium sp. G0201]